MTLPFSIARMEMAAYYRLCIRQVEQQGYRQDANVVLSGFETLGWESDWE